ncbi:MAG: hypothetical protein M3542_06895 [Acidobacteriota bacterium]|nr:hypothetical protein [Acidobacteriota bacterium]
MNKTIIRCLSLAIVIVGVMVIGSGVAQGQTGLGVTITCDDGGTAQQGDLSYLCFFTIENAGASDVTGLAVLVTPPGGSAAAAQCFQGVTAVTTLGAAGSLTDQCTGELINGAIPYTCGSAPVEQLFTVVASSSGNAGGSATSGFFIAGITCADQDACTVNECIPTADARTEEGCFFGTQINCVDADACTVDTCNSTSGCVHTPSTDPLCTEIDGRMTGGGSVFDGANRITHGFELHCDVEVGPNNLQINWGRGNRFHLTELLTATCTDDSTIDQRPPGHSTFDTYVGTGTGLCNGVEGALIEFTFTDYGEPGKLDTVDIAITGCPTGVDDLTVSGPLKKGNHQAHRAN